MLREVPGKCPVCGGKTEVTKISCNSCDTRIEGHFQLCRFCRLTEEQKVFIDAFLKCRGNIKEVEKELGVSYPTVKNKLEDVIGALGYKTEPGVEDQGRKKEVLEKLGNGELTVEQTLEILKEQ